MAPKIKLTYFNARGRAEYIRLAFAAGGVEFEDERVDGAGFGKMKSDGSLIFGSLPVLEVDGQQFGESGAILRYAGKLSGLYPKDDLECMKVDAVIDVMETVMLAAYREKSEEARTSFVKNDIPRYFGPVEKMLRDSKGPFILGEQMSVADLKLSVLATFLEQGILDHVPTDVLNSYPNIVAATKAVNRNPKIAKWNEDHK